MGTSWGHNKQVRPRLPWLSSDRGTGAPRSCPPAAPPSFSHEAAALPGGVDRAHCRQSRQGIGQWHFLCGHFVRASYPRACSPSESCRRSGFGRWRRGRPGCRCSAASVSSGWRHCRRHGSKPAKQRRHLVLSWCGPVIEARPSAKPLRRRRLNLRGRPMSRNAASRKRHRSHCRYHRCRVLSYSLAVQRQHSRCRSSPPCRRGRCLCHRYKQQRYFLWE